MNKTIFKSILTTLCLCFAGIMGACSGTEAAVVELSAIGAADDVVLLAGHPSEIMENADCTMGKDGIALSKALQTIFDEGMSPREKDYLEKLTKARGINFSNTFFKVTAANDAVLAFALTDPKAFGDWMTKDMDMTCTEEGEYTIYDLDSEGKIFVNQGNAYCVTMKSEDCTLQAFEALMAKAAQNPLEQWKKDVLAQKKNCVALVSGSLLADAIIQAQTLSADQSGIDEIKSSFMLIESSLLGSKLNITTSLRQADGKAIEPSIKLNPIDLKVFKFMDKDDQMVMVASIPGDVDWRVLVESLAQQMNVNINRSRDKEVIDLVIKVLEDMEGTTFIAAQCKDFNRMAHGPEYWNLTIGAQMKPGAATKYVNMLVGMARQYSNFGLKIQETPNGTKVSLDPFTVYLKDVNGTFVASTLPITEQGSTPTLINEDYFKNQLYALELTAPKGSEFNSDIVLPFQPVLAIATNGKGVTIDIETIGGTDARLLANIFSFIAELSQK